MDILIIHLDPHVYLFVHYHYFRFFFFFFELPYIYLITHNQSCVSKKILIMCIKFWLAFVRLEKLLGIGMERRLKKSLKVVEEYINDAVAARKQSPSDDLLSRFMKKRDGDRFSAAVLHRIALNFVLAGRDTSSVALTWFFWLVMNHPHVEEKIISEISTVLRQTRGDDPRRWIEEPLVFDEADKLVYLKAALAETLRLYPSVPQDFKYVVADDVLPDGTFVPAGSTVTYSIYSVGRMKSIWGRIVRSLNRTGGCLPPGTGSRGQRMPTNLWRLMLDRGLVWGRIWLICKWSPLPPPYSSGTG